MAMTQSKRTAFMRLYLCARALGHGRGNLTHPSTCWINKPPEIYSDGLLNFKEGMVILRHISKSKVSIGMD